MRTKTLLVAMVSLMLASCSTVVRKPTYPLDFFRFASEQKCDQNAEECNVPVTVDDCDAGKFTVPFKLYLQTDASHPTRKITWTLSNSSGYEFSKEKFKYAIFIKFDGGDEFSNADVSNNGKSVTIHFKRGAHPSDYVYALTVKRTDGEKNFCTTLDPWMIS